MIGLPFKKKSSHLLGIEFQVEGMALVLAKTSRERPEVSDVEFIEYDKSLTVTRQLKDWVDAHHCQHAACRVVLNPDQYQLLLVEPPDVPEEELRDAIRWRLKDLISMTPDQAAIDFFKLPADGTKSNKKMIYIVAAESERIKSLVALVSDAHLRLESIDIGELSFRNFTSALLCKDEQTRGMVMVRITPKAGCLYIFRDSNLYLARSFSLNYEGGLLDDLPVDALSLEIQRSIDYYERQMGQAPPMVIYVCGEHISSDKVTDELKRGFTVPLQHLDPKCVWHNLEHLDDALMQRCIGAMGGLLREEEAA